MEQYRIKTRNWNANKYIALALNFIAWLTGADVYKSTDHDNKYYLQTQSMFRAWAAWILFIALKPLSGGWTYIIRKGLDLDEGYKAIY